MSHNTFHVSIHVKDIPTAVAHYTKMADRKRLAQSAMRKQLRA